MDICSSMFARKKNSPPRNLGGMQQILRCRGVPRCGAAPELLRYFPARRLMRRAETRKIPAPETGAGVLGTKILCKSSTWRTILIHADLAAVFSGAAVIAARWQEKNPRPGDRDGVCGEPISSRGRPHKSNRHCTESGKSDHESGGCTERRCPCCPRRQPCRGCTHGRWLSRKRQRFRPWLRPA